MDATTASPDLARGEGLRRARRSAESLSNSNSLEVRRPYAGRSGADAGAREEAARVRRRALSRRGARCASCNGVIAVRMRKRCCGEIGIRRSPRAGSLTGGSGGAGRPAGAGMHRASRARGGPDHEAAGSRPGQPSPLLSWARGPEAMSHRPHAVLCRAARLVGFATGGVSGKRWRRLSRGR
jgi:hypothetical protein